MSLSDEERRRIEEEERFRAEARLRAEAEARQKAEVETAAKTAEEKKKSGDTAKKGCLGCLGLLVLLFVIGSLLPESKDTARPPSEPGADFKAKWTAQQLIDDWRGESGARHWKDSLPLQNLYAVRDHEHVASGGWKREDATWEPNRAWHRFRVHYQIQHQGRLPGREVVGYQSRKDWFRVEGDVGHRSSVRRRRGHQCTHAWSRSMVENSDRTACLSAFTVTSSLRARHR